MFIVYFSIYLVFFCFKKGFFGLDDIVDFYICFVGSDVVQGYQGQVIIGVCQMFSVEYDYYIMKLYVLLMFLIGSGIFFINYII